MGLLRYHRVGAPVGRTSSYSSIFVLLTAILLTGCSLPAQAHSDTETAAPKPEAARAEIPPVEPYKLPTFKGQKPAITHNIAPYIKTPRLNADAIYQRVLACYPQKSKWQIDVDLRAAMTAADSSFYSSADTSSIGSNYVQIVAAMPLYSATEMDRATKNEHDLRQETAKTVAQLVKAIAARNHALRKIALYTSLEKRSAIRVQGGVVGTTEQVTYLEKVAKAYEAEIDAETDIMTARLALAALCAGDQYDTMNAYLAAISRAPQ